MKDKKQAPEIIETETIKTERAIITIYRPKITKEEKNRILKEIARIKASWYWD